MRCALVLFTKKDAEGFHIHKLENIDPDRFDSAILCLQDGRAHEVFLEAAKRASGDAKRARTAPQAERGRTDGVL